MPPAGIEKQVSKPYFKGISVLLGQFLVKSFA